MRIAFFNWRDVKNPSAGGAEIYNHEVLRRFVQMGHEVTIFTSSYPGSLPRETIDGIEHIRYAGRFLIYAKARSCYKESIEGKYDLIVESINGVPFFTALFAKEKIVPFIHQLTRENWYSGMVLPLALAGYYAEDHMLKLYKDRPSIAPSQSTKNDLERIGFADVSVVNGGSSIQSPKQLLKEKQPTLIYLGRLTKSKRVDHAISALSKIRKFVPEAKLRILGRGPEENNLRRLASDLKVSDAVEFFGFVDEKEKIYLLSTSHAMLFPAAREGWGLTVVEANRCGTPVIGYDVPGLRDSIRHGINGYLVRSGDVEGMAGAASSLLKNKEELKQLSLNAMEYSRQFSWDKSADEFLSVLERCMK